MDSSPSQPRPRIADYELIREIGRGGMGVVYEARQVSLDRPVALKFMTAPALEGREMHARFLREARTAAALNHPAVCTVHEVREVGEGEGTELPGGPRLAPGTPFIAMEWIDGRPLSSLVGSPELRDPERQIAIAAQIAEGLAAAHAKGIVHRDLKPANVMITADGRAKIVDFGLAKPVFATGAIPTEATQTTPEALTRAGGILGTVAYMSPEQATGKALDARSDVFSFGTLLYEVATGQRPFRGDDGISILSSVLRDTPEPLASAAPRVPSGLDRIVRRCLEKDPAKRYPDGAALRDDLRALHRELVSGPARFGPVPTRSRGARIAAAAAVVILVAAAAAWWIPRSARARWVRNEALPKLEGIVDRIQGLEEGRESWDAYVLAGQIEAVAPGDPIVERLRPKFTREITITSDPPGAEVRARYYDEPGAEPVVVGKTPLTKIRYARGFTRIEVALPGRRPAEDVIWNFGLVGDAWHYDLAAVAAAPEEMVYVPAGSFALFMPGLDHLAPEPTAAFLMDRREVTNRDYKRFVDAGGYTDPRYWKEPFRDGGRELSWKDAIARFTDRTGRPGPSGWEVGSYPDGAADLPASGISWYEAAAYAAWAGKSLPTLFHWNRVAFTVASSRIVPMANLAAKGPVPVGSTKSMNRFGAYDLAGNVREWVWNRSGAAGDRFILGGGWNDPDYGFNDAYAQSSFDRTPTNGFRCIRPLGDEPNRAALERAIDRPFRDFLAERPVPDAVFAQYLRQFAYDKTALDARIEEEKATPTGIRQRITFNAAYGGERMMAYLFLPRGGKPPFQVVIEFPGSGSIDIRSSENLELGRIDFVPKSGRAVLFPIYKGTYERGGDLHSDLPSETASFKDYLVMWEKDLARSIDYVETRKDLDAGRIAYYGLSWGAELGAILPAVETRIRANILYVAGLSFQRALPEADALNYIGRVKQPTLMLNGELDFFFPSETSQKPMFQLFGTPAADKKRLVYPGGHSVPRTEQIKESLAWLDRYLGVVDR